MFQIKTSSKRISTYKRESEFFGKLEIILNFLRFWGEFFEEIFQNCWRILWEFFWEFRNCLGMYSSRVLIWEFFGNFKLQMLTQSCKYDMNLGNFRDKDKKHFVIFS